MNQVALKDRPKLFKGLMVGTQLNRLVKHSAIQALAALSKNLGFPISVEVNPVEKSTWKDLGEKIFSNEKIVGAYGAFATPAGAYCFLCRPESAHEFCNLILGHQTIRKIFMDSEKQILCDMTALIANNFIINLTGSLEAKPIFIGPSNFIANQFSNVAESMVKQCKACDDDPNVLDINFNLRYANFFGFVWFLFSNKEFYRQLKHD